MMLNVGNIKIIFCMCHVPSRNKILAMDERSIDLDDKIYVVSTLQNCMPEFINYTLARNKILKRSTFPTIFLVNESTYVISAQILYNYLFNALKTVSFESCSNYIIRPKRKTKL